MTWPVTLTHGNVTLRPLRLRDHRRWRELRSRNVEWLKPWEGTLPPNTAHPSELPNSFSAMVRRQRREAQLGTLLPWLITVDENLAGQITVGGITYGSQRGAYIGYWIDRDHAGRGIMPTAVAMAIDYCFQHLELHRIEINIRPENAASLRVVEKLGLRNEGLSPKYLHIDGAWRDHLRFAVTEDEARMGMMERLRPAPEPEDP